MSEINKEKIIRAVQTSKECLERILEEVNFDYNFTFREIKLAKHKLETSMRMLKETQNKETFSSKNIVSSLIDWSVPNLIDWYSNKGGEIIR